VDCFLLCSSEKLALPQAFLFAFLLRKLTDSRPLQNTPFIAKSKDGIIAIYTPNSGSPFGLLSCLQIQDSIRPG